MYEYKATVNKVVDGDTMNLTIDLGFTIYWKSNCRFAGLNAPEITSPDPITHVKALEAKQYVIDALPVNTKIKIISRELDKYGRPVIDIYYGFNFEKHLNQELLDKGLAVKY